MTAILKRGMKTARDPTHELKVGRDDDLARDHIRGAETQLPRNRGSRVAFDFRKDRVGEIGIRRVLGASVLSIILLLSKRFCKWVLIANVFAWPAAFIFMNRWLSGFAYRVHMGWSLFILAGSAAFLIALVTIGTQAVKSALANPADSLRYE